MSTKVEKRSLASELRADSQGGMSLVGYAALFNSPSKDLGGYREVISPRAFDRSLREGDDVKALVNHDPSQLLGRTKNGTLVLSADNRGLRFKVLLNPESQAHRDLHAAVKRGDYDECSFAFKVNDDDGQEWDTAQDENGNRYSRRTLKSVKLLDVSPAVTYPAYSTTSVSARSLSDYSDSDTAWLARKQKFVRQVNDQIAREELRDRLLDGIMAGRGSEESTADRELAERMAVRAGRTTR